MSHCSGTLQPVIDRIGIFGWFLGAPENQADAYKKILKIFPSASTSTWPAFPSRSRSMACCACSAASRILYGRDFPYTVVEMVRGLCDDVDSEFKKLFYFWQRSDINSDNAERLFGFKSANVEQGLEAEKKNSSLALRTLKDCFCL
jgi:hypothetical protein